MYVRKMSEEVILHEIPLLRTPRVLLRPFVPEDAHPLFELYSSPVVMAWNVFPPFKRLYEAEDLLKYHALLFASRRGIRWAIALPETSTLIGTCGYHNWQPQDREAELSYELSPDYWRQGLMTESLRPALAFGLTKMKLQRIRAKVMRNNIASIRLLQKFGFQVDLNAAVPEPRIQQGREISWYEFRIAS